MATYTSIQIANWFIRKAKNEKAELTPMKLLKLVYIAHGWHLGLSNGKPLVGEDVQAWKFGPVFPDLYHRIKKYGGGQIEDFIAVAEDDIAIVPSSDVFVAALLDKIWEVYGGANGVELSELTHADGTPWSKTWNKMQKRGMTQSAIDADEIVTHYKKLMAA